MPLYEYKCQQCHRNTEKRQKFSDPEITKCPHCGGLLERVLSAPAIAFKGGGWYADGYGNSKPKAAGDATTAGEGKSNPAASDSSAKPAASENSSGSSAAASSSSTPAPAAPSAPPATSGKS